jgi:hypothetical protein
MWSAYFEFLAELGRQRWVDAIEFVPIDNRSPGVICGEIPALVDADGVVPEESLPHPKTFERPLVSCANIFSGGVPSAIVSLCPRQPLPQHRVFLWPGRQLDTPHALRAVYECMTSEGQNPALRVPLGPPVTSDAATRALALQYVQGALCAEVQG